MALWLVHSTPNRATRVQALAGDTVLCSWQAETLYSHNTSLLSVVQSGTREFNAGSNLAMD